MVRGIVKPVGNEHPLVMLLLKLVVVLDEVVEADAYVRQGTVADDVEESGPTRTIHLDFIQSLRINILFTFRKKLLRIYFLSTCSYYIGQA